MLIRANFERSMELYKNLSGNSGVEGFEIGFDYITVWFKNCDRSYTYSNDKAGKITVDRMKIYALEGKGLNTIILHNARYKYD